jgi:hypothetical protein
MGGGRGEGPGGSGVRDGGGKGLPGGGTGQAAAPSGYTQVIACPGPLVNADAAAASSLYDQCGGRGGSCNSYQCQDGPFPGQSCPAGSSCQRQSEAALSTGGPAGRWLTCCTCGAERHRRRRPRCRFKHSGWLALCR